MLHVLHSATLDGNRVADAALLRALGEVRRTHARTHTHTRVRNSALTQPGPQHWRVTRQIDRELRLDAAMLARGVGGEVVRRGPRRAAARSLTRPRACPLCAAQMVDLRMAKTLLQDVLATKVHKDDIRRVIAQAGHPSPNLGPKSTFLSL